MPSPVGVARCGHADRWVEVGITHWLPRALADEAPWIIRDLVCGGDPDHPDGMSCWEEFNLRGVRFVIKALPPDGDLYVVAAERGHGFACVDL